MGVRYRGGSVDAPGVNPFDQPDVEEAKNKARTLVGTGGETADSGPTLESALEDILSVPYSPGSYVALAAYLPETDELTGAFSRLRKAITERTRLATMFGYGPRYLHSTGQLLKGGPANGRLLVITSDNAVDISVPDEAFTLGNLPSAGHSRRGRDAGTRKGCGPCYFERRLRKFGRRGGSGHRSKQRLAGLEQSE